jgi:hypothetical protein
VRMGFFDAPQPVIFQLYQETLQKFRLSAEGLREPFAPADASPPDSGTAFTRCRSWYPAPFGEALDDEEAYPVPRHHAAAGGHVPFVGVDECLAAPDPHPQSALCAGPHL